MASRRSDSGRSGRGSSQYSGEGRTYSRSSSRRSASGSRSASRSASGQGSSSANRYSRNSEAYVSDYPQAARYEQQYTQAGGAAAQYSRANTDSYSHQRARKSGRGKRVLVIVIAAVLAILIAAGVAAALFVNGLNNSLHAGKSAEESLAIQEKLVKTKSFDDPFYMLLIGSDAREGDSDMGQRSDTTILVRVDPVHHVVSMLSIPRDTKVQYYGGTIKFNAAYSYDGTAGAIEAASDLCGVDIAHYAEVDFNSLVDIVDAIGGVDVYVENRIDNWKAGDEIIEAGPQTLNGAQALVYARDRDYADGDFTRTLHQRNLVNAMIEKVMSLNVAELPGVLQTACRSVTTDLTVNDIYSLAMQFIVMDDLQIYSIMVPSTTAYIDGVSYVLANNDALSRVIKAMEQGIDPNTVVDETDGAVTGGDQSYPTY